MNNFTVFSSIFLCIFVFISFKADAAERSQTDEYPRDHRTYLYNYMYKKWPKLRDRCKVIPNWQINGTNPILEEGEKGYTVVLFLIKRTCEFCLSQLDYLNDLAKYYRATERKISFVALNHKKQPLPRSIYEAYPYVKIYEEPVNQDIFKQLRASWKHILIYDACGRKQYHFNWPYSWLGYPFVRFAMLNTFRHHVRLCGKCKPRDVPTTKYVTTTTTITTTTTKPTIISYKIKNIDGPFTNT